MHRRIRQAATAAFLAIGCRAAPGGDVTLGETIVELSDAVNALRQETAMMQSQLDSLRDAVARQDTLVRRLAGMAGISQ